MLTTSTLNSNLLPWMVICPQPQTELRAYRWLAYSGCVPYIPLGQKSVRQNFHKRRMVTRPIFPGYVFCRLHPERSLWDQIESAPVTMRLCKIGGSPIHLDDSHIEALRQMEFRINHPAPPVPPPRLRPGDVVEIIVDSVWSKHLAVVVYVDTPGRIGLLLEFFKRQTRIAVSASQVRLVEGSRR